MKLLREKAMMKDKLKEIHAKELEKQKKITDLKNRVISLPSLCDALRSKCLSTNRTSIKKSDLLNMMTTELNLNQRELSERLLMLSQIVPEFITIVPADNIVPISTFRINLSTLYKEVKNKVTTYVSSAEVN